jgi:hypothetical protein
MGDSGKFESPVPRGGDMTNPSLDDGEGPDPELEPGRGRDGEARIICPWCGEEVEIALDPGGGPDQEYVEDCEVCCQPWLVRVRLDASGEAEVWVERSGE